jgi:hypothetical protein
LLRGSKENNPTKSTCTLVLIDPVGRTEEERFPAEIEDGWRRRIWGRKTRILLLIPCTTFQSHRWLYKQDDAPIAAPGLITQYDPVTGTYFSKSFSSWADITPRCANENPGRANDRAVDAGGMSSRCLADPAVAPKLYPRQFLPHDRHCPRLGGKSAILVTTRAQREDLFSENLHLGQIAIRKVGFCHGAINISDRCLASSDAGQGGGHQTRTDDQYDQKSPHCNDPRGPDSLRALL